MTFCISALAPSQFDHLLGASEKTLREAGAQRLEVDANPGFPCRISLGEAAVGETVILLNYEHLAVASPYRSRHAIFVREKAQPHVPIPGQIPESIRLRLLSVRAFDAEGMMVYADVVHGRDLESALISILENPKVDFVHLHNAKPGCFAARVDRVQDLRSRGASSRRTTTPHQHLSRSPGRPRATSTVSDGGAGFIGRTA